MSLDKSMIELLNADIQKQGVNLQQFADGLELIAMRLVAAEETINEVVDAFTKYKSVVTSLKDKVNTLVPDEPRDGVEL